MSSADPKRIIAIDLRTQSLGFVVHEGADRILDWGVKSFRGGVNMVRDPLGLKISRLIAAYVPDASEYQNGSSYFMRKMHAYIAYAREGKHTARYGIGNFRVITVTPTKQRALNLCAKLKDAGETRGTEMVGKNVKSLGILPDCQ
jgi:hypothetical protein